MKTIRIPERSKNDLWHVEAPGCIINIRPYLTNEKGEKTVAIEVLANADRYSGEPQWWIVDEDKVGHDHTIRVVQRPNKSVAKQSRNPVIRVTWSRKNRAITFRRADGSSHSYPDTVRHLFIVNRACSSLATQEQRGQFRFLDNQTVFYRPMATGNKAHREWRFEYMNLEILSDLSLKIKLTEAGRQQIAEMEDQDKSYFEINDELWGEACTNGFTLDPDDDGRSFVSLVGLDDDGKMDYKLGDLGWYHDDYVYRSWWKEDEIVFKPYYFGDTNLDQQGDL